MSRTQSRALPAVAAAILAAGGVIYVVEHHRPGRQITKDESDHTLRAEITTSGNALMVLLVESGWRGEIYSDSIGVSKFHAVDVYVLEGEPITAVLLGRQSPAERRQQVTCRLLWDGQQVSKVSTIVRSGESEKTVTCRY